MIKNLKNVQMAFGRVFANASYIALASALAAAAFLFAVWLPNLGLLTDIFATSSTPFAVKLNIAISLLGGISTNFSLLSAGYTIAIAALFGINIAMIAYHLKRNKAGLQRQEIMAGVGGVFSGALGIGCAACGSFLLSSFLFFTGASGALALLPLRGGEFGILSVLFLFIALALISKKIQAPLICKPN